MPALLWVAFWSWMMGSAACIGGEPRSVHIRARDDRDHPAV
jgi:hypothetical protein